MATRGRCPKCSAALMIPDDLPGGKVRCPRCDGVIEASEALEPPAGEVETITTNPVAPTYEKVSHRKRRDDPPAPSRWEDDEDLDWGTRLRRLHPRKGAALAKVRGPAILLMVWGVLCILAGFAALGFIFIADDEERIVAAVVCTAITLFSVMIGGVTIFGAIRMRALKSYGLALTTVILTFVMAFLICTPAVLIGVWPLVVLMDTEVKENFDTPD